MPIGHQGYANSITPQPRFVGPFVCPKDGVKRMSALPAMSADSRAQQQRLFRQVMGRFATGVTVITTRVDTETFGMTANAFMAGSLEPMLCVVSINHSAQMHARLRRAGHFGVSFLTQQQQHLAAHFAGRPLARLIPDFELRGPTPSAPRG